MKNRRKERGEVHNRRPNSKKSDKETERRDITEFCDYFSKSQNQRWLTFSALNGVPLMDWDNPEEKTGFLEEKNHWGRRKEDRENNSRYISISDSSRNIHVWLDFKNGDDI